MLTLDYANCLADRVADHGLDPDLLAPGGEADHACRSLTQRLAKTRGTGWERWRNLPMDPMRSEHLRAVKSAVERCRAQQFANLVVLGIGGSALGNSALQGALNPPTYNLVPEDQRPGPRLFVIDNVDPDHFSSVLRFCAKTPGGWQRTLFNVISKSGETAETAAQFMIVYDILKKAFGDHARDHVLAITDPAKGTMRAICEREGFATLPVPDGVGGRFSVLSPVGLFSGAMCGIDIDALLTGAADMDAACSREDLTQNPAAMLAFLLVELGQRKGKSNHVLMPYASGLYGLADWFRQLWAESLGKKQSLTFEKVYAGFTPIKALGTTDQHSQVQLYREGPNDKVIGFLEVVNWRGHQARGESDPILMPSGFGVEPLKYLEGKSMADLILAEKRATEYALVESERPNFTIRFPQVDAYHVGQFIQLWQVATAYAGLMLSVDAYDQPAVELGKQATFGLMGRPGYEKHLDAVKRTLAPSGRVIER